MVDIGSVLERTPWAWLKSVAVTSQLLKLCGYGEMNPRTIPSESLFVMGLPPGSTMETRQEKPTMDSSLLMFCRLFDHDAQETITAFFGQFAGVAFASPSERLET